MSATKFFLIFLSVRRLLSTLSRHFSTNKKCFSHHDWFFTFTILKPIFNYQIKWKPLNVITLGQSETDNMNWMITITNHQLLFQWCLIISNKWDLWNLITLTVITLSGFHCTCNEIPSTHAKMNPIFKPNTH